MSHKYIQTPQEQKDSILKVDIIRECKFDFLYWAYVDEQGFHACINEKEYFAETTNKLIQKINGQINPSPQSNN